MSSTGYAPAGAIVVNGSTLINGRGGSVVDVVIDGMTIVEVDADCPACEPEFAPQPTVNVVKQAIAQPVQNFRRPTDAGVPVVLAMGAIVA
jgi:hypothetical protein